MFRAPPACSSATTFTLIRVARADRDRTTTPAADCSTPAPELMRIAAVLRSRRGAERHAVLDRMPPARPLTWRTAGDLRIEQPGVEQPRPPALVLISIRRGPPAKRQLKLIESIENAGFLVSGPTDARVAEHGEPAWVCNARQELADLGTAGRRKSW